MMKVTVFSKAVGLAAAFALGWQGNMENARAASYGWNVDADGNWVDTTKWTPAGSPDAIDDIANLAGTLNLTGNRMVTLPSGSITVGAINLGDTGDGSHAFSINGAGSANSNVIFDVTSGNATLAKVSGGTANVGNSSAANSLSIQLNDDLDVSNVYSSGSSSTFSLFAAISGTGGVNLTAEKGRIDFNGINTYAGNTVINSAASNVRMRIANSLPSGSGKGNLVINNGGKLDIAGFSQSINALNGSGVIDYSSAPAGSSSNPILTFGNNDASGLFSGSIITTLAGKTLNLAKVGAGTQTLSGANTYNGTTTISGGTLLVNSTHTGGQAYAVESGATLGGSGTTSAIAVVNSGAFLAPGASIGTLSLGGATIAGTLRLEYNGDTSALDMLNIAGALDISAATVDFDNLGLASLSGGPYVLAIYGSLTGSAFANVVDLPSGYSLNYAYLGNQIALVASVVPGDFDSDGDVDGADFAALENFPHRIIRCT